MAWAESGRGTDKGLWAEGPTRACGPLGWRGPRRADNGLWGGGPPRLWDSRTRACGIAKGHWGGVCLPDLAGLRGRQAPVGPLGLAGQRPLGMWGEGRPRASGADKGLWDSRGHGPVGLWGGCGPRDGQGPPRPTSACGIAKGHWGGVCLPDLAGLRASEADKGLWGLWGLWA